MRVLVTGDRDWSHDVKVDNNPLLIDIIQVLLEGFAAYGECHNMDGTEPFVVIEGEARGADRIAGDWVREFEPETGCGCRVELESYPAKWDEHGRAAGPIRNALMPKEGKPDVVLAFHDDLENSKGTKHMVTIARKAGVPVYHIRSVP